MTVSEFIQLIKSPDSVSFSDAADLKQMAEYYPYFAQVRVLLAKCMKDADDTAAENYINAAALYSSDIREFYFYLNPENKILTDENFTRDARNSGDYFSMLEKIENRGGDTRQSLKSLAEKLKKAREKLQTTSHNSSSFQGIERQARDDGVLEKPSEKPEISENLAKKLIAEKKYSAAIEILKQLNLLNPKKSIYFAAQIRFLEKAVENINKN